MPSQNNNPPAKKRKFLAVCLLVALLLTHGCARHQWTQPVAEDLEKTSIRLLSTMVAREKQCAQGIDTEAIITWNSPLKDTAFSGYLLALPPRSMKFVVPNFLGQPLAALVVTENSFSSINTTNRIFSRGKLQSLALRYDIPLTLLDHPWAFWLTGQLGSEQPEATAVFHDAASRGVWIETTGQQSKKTKDYLLIDPQRKRLLSRVVTDETGTITGTITYSNWRQNSSCSFPETLTITDFAPGTEIVITYSDTINTAALTQANFALTPPPGYTLQLMP